MKIGIPRSLFYYKFISFWEKFFAELGAEVVVSEQTNKRILDDGVRACVDEACLPIKIFYGHVINLKNRVDYILVPRFTSISKKEYICPEFGGLPDMIRHTLKDLPRLIDTEVNLRNSKRGGLKAAIQTGAILGVDRRTAVRAYKSALQFGDGSHKSAVGGSSISGDGSHKSAGGGSSICGDGSHKSAGGGSLISGDGSHISTVGGNSNQSEKVEKRPQSEKVEKRPQSEKVEKRPQSEKVEKRPQSEKVEKRPQGCHRVAVIGHPYNVYDRYISMDLLGKLSKYGVEARTIEMVEEAEINAQAAALEKPMFWNYGRMAYGAALHMAEAGMIEGFICVTSFGCGIDSFVNDLIERSIRRKYNIPFITMTIDEHTGEAGFNTRLEAFVDMLRWRSRNENHISAFG